MKYLEWAAMRASVPVAGPTKPYQIPIGRGRDGIRGIVGASATSIIGRESPSPLPPACVGPD